MSYSNQRNNHINQQLLLNIYVEMYNRAARQIDTLYTTMDDIRQQIFILNNLSDPNPNNSPNPGEHSNRNRNRNRNRNQRYNPNNMWTPYHLQTTPMFTHTYLSNTNNASNTSNSSNAIRELNERNYQQLTGINLRNILRNFYDPVIVAPTQDEIQRASRELRFGDIVNPPNDSCPISLERFVENSQVTQLNHCGHIFNPTQISCWFETNVHCPMCRHDIRSVSENIIPESFSNINSNINSNSSAAEEDTNVDEPIISPSLSPPARGQNYTNLHYDSEEVSFDISNNDLVNSLANLATQALSDIFLNTNNSNQNRGNNRSSFLYDPSNNVIMMETFLSRRT